MFLPTCWLFRAAHPRSNVQFGPGLESGSLGLRVEDSNGQFLLSWNRRSALVENATKATLTIVDGDHNEDVDLDLATLRNGSLVYSPITGDVSFRLEVVDDRGTHDAAMVRSSGRLPARREEELPVKPAAEPENVPLGLRVESSSGQLLLAWNRQSGLIENTTKATLTIVDGDHTEDVDLDLATLRNGSITYSPVTGDVSFRLEVVDAKRGARQTDSVRFSGPAPLHPPARPVE
jgi:copper chaperone CopZ